jgi:magnesium-transporting ATPase (P-type)
MGFLTFYLTGAIFVFASIFIWNRFVINEYKNDELSPEAFSLPTALMAALSSWGIVIVIAILAIASYFIYLITGTDWAKRANQWFTMGGAD